MDRYRLSAIKARNTNSILSVRLIIRVVMEFASTWLVVLENQVSLNRHRTRTRFIVITFMSYKLYQHLPLFTTDYRFIIKTLRSNATLQHESKYWKKTFLDRNENITINQNFKLFGSCLRSLSTCIFCITLSLRVCLNIYMRWAPLKS